MNVVFILDLDAVVQKKTIPYKCCKFLMINGMGLHVRMTPLIGHDIDMHHHLLTLDMLVLNILVQWKN